jgi:arylsulfatase A-like enzyme
MPEVKRSLVERGVTFSESFTTSSLCCPSRASILTGAYQHTTGVYRQGGRQGGSGSVWSDLLDEPDEPKDHHKSQKHERRGNRRRPE